MANQPQLNIKDELTYWTVKRTVKARDQHSCGSGDLLCKLAKAVEQCPS